MFIRKYPRGRVKANVPEIPLRVGIRPPSTELSEYRIVRAATVSVCVSSTCRRVQGVRVCVCCIVDVVVLCVKQ